MPAAGAAIPLSRGGAESAENENADGFRPGLLEWILVLWGDGHVTAEKPESFAPRVARDNEERKQAGLPELPAE